MQPDHINALFQVGGASMIWLSIRRLYVDKHIKGVHPLPIAFFSFLGLWNLYFFTTLHQWYSVMGGLAIVTSNLIWLGQMFYYGRQHVKRDSQ